MNFNYTVLGNGDKNILLLHGWGGSLKSLSSLQKSLEKYKDLKIYNLELPGFGESIGISSSLHYEDYVDFVYKFINTLNIKNPIIIGHSFGGKVSIGLTMKHSEHVEKLVLINSSGIKPKNEFKKALFYIPTKMFGFILSLPLLRQIKNNVRIIYYKYVVRERDYLNNEIMRTTLRNVLQKNFSEELQDIKVPTLLIWGEKDSYTPVWMGREMSKLIPKSRLEIVKEAKHNLPVVSADMVSKLIYLFIK